MTISAATTFDEFLVENELLSGADQASLHRICDVSGESIIPVIERISSLRGAKLAKAVSEFYRIALVAPEDWPSALLFAEDLSRKFLLKNCVIPIADCGTSMILAMEDPQSLDAIDAVRLATGKQVTPRVASREKIRSTIEKLAPGEALSGISDAWMDIEGASAGATSVGGVDQLRDVALGAPVILFVDELLIEASRARATDIHIEPYDGKLNIRIRVDGMLRHHAAPPPAMGKPIVSRVKILSGLNIAEKRLPQDGRARVIIDGRQFDLRVATMPTVYGESVTIRLLDNMRRSLDFSNLGFNSAHEQQFRKHLNASHGLIIVTGPTGSGKTTTLATAIY